MTTAYQWYREGTLPVLAQKVGRLVLVSPEAAAGTGRADAAGLYALVSSRDQEADLDRRVARLSSRAARAGLPVARAGAGAGVNGTRARARWLLAGPAVTVVAAGRRDGLGRMSAELAGSALAASGRSMVVAGHGEVTDDLARDMAEVPASFCARQGIGPRASAGSGPDGITG